MTKDQEIEQLRLEVVQLRALMGVEVPENTTRVDIRIAHKGQCYAIAELFDDSNLEGSRMQKLSPFMLTMRELLESVFPDEPQTLVS